MSTVYSNPRAELAVDNAKYVKNCTDMYLGKKSIEAITGFEKFVNLEVLWINGNKLKKINNLDSNFRIKRLYAQNNKIGTLVGSLARFKFIERLHLFNNSLTNLDKCLDVLSKMAHLEQLDLFKNPITDELNYRLRVIYALPLSLTILDRQIITDDERVLAERLLGRNRKVLTNNDSASRFPEELVGRLSGATVLLLQNIEEARRRREEELTLEDCELEDRLHITRIPKPSFWNKSYSNGTELSEWEGYLVAKIVDNSTSGLEEMIDEIELSLARTLTNRTSLIGSIADNKEMGERFLKNEIITHGIWNSFTASECEERAAECFKTASRSHLVATSNQDTDLVKKVNRMSQMGYRLISRQNNVLAESRSSPSLKLHGDIYSMHLRQNTQAKQADWEANPSLKRYGLKDIEMATIRKTSLKTYIL